MIDKNSSQELRNITGHTLAVATSPSKDPWQQNKHQCWTWWPDKNWINSSKNNNGKIHLQMDIAESQEEYFWKSSNVIAPRLSHHTDLMLPFSYICWQSVSDSIWYRKASVLPAMWMNMMITSSKKEKKNPYKWPWIPLWWISRSLAYTTWEARITLFLTHSKHTFESFC